MQVKRIFACQELTLELDKKRSIRTFPLDFQNGGNPILLCETRNALVLWGPLRLFGCCEALGTALEFLIRSNEGSMTFREIWQKHAIHFRGPPVTVPAAITLNGWFISPFEICKQSLKSRHLVLENVKFPPFLMELFSQ